MNSSSTSFWSYSKPSYFMRATRALLPYTFWISLLVLSIGFCLGLFFVASDAQQGENYKIMYLHVPCAWMSLLLYSFLALLSLAYLIWHHPLTTVLARSCALLGTCFTGITLITGSLWGYPVWGTFWVWDARLTSVLVLFFLYIGYLLFISSFSNPLQGLKVASLLALVGFINIPIIKFSVDWWNTLHQSSSVTQMQSSIHSSMLIPLLLIFLGFLFYSAYCLFLELRREILEKKTRSLEVLRNESGF